MLCKTSYNNCCQHNLSLLWQVYQWWEGVSAAYYNLNKNPLMTETTLPMTSNNFNSSQHNFHFLAIAGKAMTPRCITANDPKKNSVKSLATTICFYHICFLMQFRSKLALWDSSSLPKNCLLLKEINIQENLDSWALTFKATLSVKQSHIFTKPSHCCHWLPLGQGVVVKCIQCFWQSWLPTAKYPFFLIFSW